MLQRLFPWIVAPALLFLTVACADEASNDTAVADEPEVEVVEDETPVVQASTSWGYGAEGGPADWGLMNEEYAACAHGTEQSPINITPSSAESTDLAALDFDWSGGELMMEDTGLGFKATPSGDHTLTIGEDTYRLLQFHAHTPSEHTLDGKSFPMEIHFVHQNDAGELAVVGVMIESGSMNADYASTVSAATAMGGAFNVENLISLLPETYGYFTYPGSLTTPPCSEGVRWIVLKQPITLGADQIAAFANAHGVTNRPVQPVGSRTLQASM